MDESDAPVLLAIDGNSLVHRSFHAQARTGQPDWADITIGYRGPRIDRAGLLRYLASFRDHAEFHEQCVERVFAGVMARCAPEWLSVEARYTRRGGLDINPWRATPGTSAPVPLRTSRQ